MERSLVMSKFIEENSKMNGKRGKGERGTGRGGEGR